VRAVTAANVHEDRGARRGGRVFFPPETYMIGGSNERDGIWITGSNIELVGSGAGCTTLIHAVANFASQVIVSSLRHILELLELMLPFPLSTGHGLLSDISNNDTVSYVVKDHP
jgi:hypothetical protein